VTTRTTRRPNVRAMMKPRHVSGILEPKVQPHHSQPRSTDFVAHSIGKATTPTSQQTNLDIATVTRWCNPRLLLYRLACVVGAGRP
jgi:hypothetical protein